MRILATGVRGDEHDPGRRDHRCVRHGVYPPAHSPAVPRPDGALVFVALGVVRWLFSIPRKIESDHLFQQGRQLERNGNAEAAVRCYEQALVRSPDNTAIALRLLSVYNAALQINKAKDLIQRLNGRIFQEKETEELKAIVTQYRGVTFEQHGARHVMRLTD